MAIARWRILLAGIMLLSTFALPSVAVAAEYLFFSNDSTYPVNANALVLDFDDTGGNVTLQFGNSLAEYLKWNATTGRFELSDDLFVSNNLSASGALSVAGAANIQGAATFGSTLRINGVTYTFPASDGTASGKVLKTNAAGTLSWSTDDTGLTQGTNDNRYVNTSGDTMTGALTIKKSPGTATGNTLVVDTNGLVYDATNKRVGIGTASPNGAFQVGVSPGDTTGAGWAFPARVIGEPTTLGGSKGNMILIDPSTQAANAGGGLVFAGSYAGTSAYAEWAYIRSGKTNSTNYDYSSYLALGTRLTGADTIERMRIDNLGNVGIGTTAPETKLEVTGTMSGQVLSFGNRLTGSGAVSIRTLTDSITAFQIFDKDGGNPVFNVDTINERVGIGTATPETALEVTGTMSGKSLQITGTGASPLIFTNTTTEKVGIGTASPGRKLDVVGNNGSDSDDFISLFTENGITPEGSVVLSATTADKALVVEGSGSAYFMGRDVTKDVEYLMGISTFSEAVVGSMTNHDLDLRTNNTRGRLHILSTGNVGVGTVTPETKLEVIGSMSGQTLQAQSLLTSSGALNIEGAAAFGSTIKLNGVTYTFPGGDGSASGKVLKTNSAGQLTWSDDDDGGISQSSANDLYVNVGGDTMTGALTIQKNAGTATGNTLVVDTKGLVYDATNKRVGVGTASPSSLLTLSATSPEMRLITSGDGNYARFDRSTASNTLSLHNQAVAVGGPSPAFNIHPHNTALAVDTGLPSGSSARSLGMWYKTPIENAGFVKYGTSGIFNAWIGVGLCGPTLCFSQWGGELDDTIATNDDQWHFAVVTFDGTNYRLYRDGNFVAGPTAIATDTLLTGTLTMGGTGNPSVIDEYTIYDRALTASEVTSMWAGGQGTEAAPTSGLLRHYKMDEGSGNTFADSVGGYSATSVNPASWSTGLVPMPGSLGEVTALTVQDGLYDNYEKAVITLGDVDASSIVQGQTFRVQTNSLNRLLIDNSGNVGIGTTTPETKFEVVGTASGSTLHAEQQLTSSGSLAVDGAAVFDGDLTFGNALSNAITVNAGAWTFANDTNFALSGGVNGLSFDTSTLSIDAQNHRVGIGTTAPDTALEVVGTMSGKSLQVTGTGATPIIYTDQKTGRVGIGTTTPGDKLDIDGGNVQFSGLGKGLRFMPTSVDFNIIRNYTAEYEAGLAFGSRYPMILQTATSGAFEFKDQDGNSLAAIKGTTGNAYFKGNVGIGTTSPTTKLEVVGTISGSQLRMGNATTSGSIIYSSGSTLMATQKGSSGQILTSQGTAAPTWMTPTSSLVWFIDGDCAVGTSQGAIVTMPSGFIPTSVSLRATGAPTGAALIVDLLEAGTTIFSTKPQIAATANTGGANAVFSDTNIAVGNEMRLDITQVGSTFSGSGLTVILNGTRKY